MATSGSFNTGSYDGRYYTLSWSASQSIANNQSTISWTLTANGGAVNWYAERTVEVVIAGSVVYSKSSRVQRYRGTVASGSLTLSHDGVGNKSFSASVRAAVYYSAVNCTGSGSWSLTQIPRQANLTSAPDFNDESNPTIYYSNPAGNSADTLMACISLTGSADDIKYRNVSKTGTSYTFPLTAAEREVLRKATLSGKNTRTVTFFLRTEIGGNTFYSTSAKTLTIVNANPTLNPTVVDTNAATIALTGDSSKLIRFFSNAQVSTGAAALKNASISSQSVTNGSKSVNGASGTINAIESGSFVFKATDNRGLSVEQTVNPSFVDYIKLNCNMDVPAPTIKGDLKFDIKGTYYMGGFGKESNNLGVYYRYKVNNGDYTDWIQAPLVADTKGYIATVDMTGLDYKSLYTFQAKAIDKLMEVTTGEQSVRTPPVFDWGENDFNFNVPVKFSGGISDGNKILWEGGMYMNEDHVANLSEPISEQPHGIVLVFSGYDSGALDSSFNTFFVSKQQVAAFPDCGHTFLLGINAGFSKMGAKYLYFTDTAVKGHSGNVSTGTNSGITFANNYYVLRYVIGV